jgi:SET domain-containing protein
MSKEELLQELSINTYVMLKPSNIAGIGVFAIKDIPKGCRNMFSPPDAPEDWITVTKKEIENLPLHAQQVVGNYCLFDEENYYLPANGFKKIDVSLFLNHADVPNIASINDGDYFEAITDIKAGEELLIDYGTIASNNE